MFHHLRQGLRHCIVPVLEGLQQWCRLAIVTIQHHLQMIQRCPISTPDSRTRRQEVRSGLFRDLAEPTFRGLDVDSYSSPVVRGVRMSRIESEHTHIYPPIAAFVHRRGTHRGQETISGWCRRVQCRLRNSSSKVYGKVRSQFTPHPPSHHTHRRVLADRVIRLTTCSSQAVSHLIALDLFMTRYPGEFQVTPTSNLVYHIQ